METYRLTNASIKHFRTLFNQNGNGYHIDRYIYNQGGLGIGSFFAKLFSKVLPVAKSVLTGAVKIAAPHAKGFLGDLAKEGLNQSAKALSNLQKRKRDSLDD